MQQTPMFNCQKHNNIKDFIQKTGKSTEIISISKNHTKESVKEAIACGVRIFGENRVQEATKKFADIKYVNNIQLHLTGPLQTNKTKEALEIFDIFHTLDREKLLRKFLEHKNLIKNKKFFIQVNTGKEESKSGIYPENVKNFLKLCIEGGLKNILGLMCIPPINEDPKKHFMLLQQINNNLGLSNLSIGMSGDYKIALEFDPKYIRLGTLLFGKRNET